MCELGADVNPAPNYETAEEDSESFRQMQLDMLRRENEALSAKLDDLTNKLRSHGSDQMPFAPPARRPLPTVEPTHHMQVPGGSREVLLVFEGELSDCDRQVISAKLLHLKRLLHRRLVSRLSPSPEAAGSLMHALITVHNITPPSIGERIRVQAAQELRPDQQDSLKREIAALISFTQGMSLGTEAVSFLELHEEAEELFRSLSPMVVSKPARVQVRARRRGSTIWHLCALRLASARAGDCHRLQSRHPGPAPHPRLHPQAPDPPSRGCPPPERA